MRGGRARGEKALVALEVEVRGAGSSRVRLAVIGNPSAAKLTVFVLDNVDVAAIAHTDAWKSYRWLNTLG